MIAGKISYILFLLVFAIFFVSYDGIFSFILLIFFIITSIMLWVWLLISSVKTTAELTLSKSETTDELFYHIKVNNKSFFPITHARIKLECINLFTQEKAQQHIVFSVPLKKEQIISGTIKFSGAGKYELSCKSFFITDWFKIFRRNIKKTQPANLYIWPNIYTPTLFLNSISENETDSLSSLGEKSHPTPGDFQGVRDFSDGDRLQYIHWKLSGKLNNLVVKEFTISNTNNVSILINFTEVEDILFIDAILSTAATISNLLCDNNINHIIYFLDKDNLNSFEIKEKTDIYIAFNKLLSTAYFADEDLVSLTYLSNDVNSNFENLNLICISSNSNLFEHHVFSSGELSSTLMLISDKKNENADIFSDNFKVIYINPDNIESSLSGKEL